MLGVPLLVWALSGVFFSAAAVTLHLSPLSAQTWARWDSYQYLSIASQGYQIWREPRMAQGRLVEWNGNAAWFPLYPRLMRALSRTRIPLPAAGKILAEIFWFLTLTFLWNKYLRLRPNGLLALTLAAVFPGAIYCHALFPVSLTLLLMLGYLASLLSKHFWAACFWGIVVGSCYTSCFYLSLVAVIWGWTQRDELKTGRWPEFLLAASSPVCGAVLVFCLQRLETGFWDSFFRIWEFHRHNGWSLIRLKQMIYIPTIYKPTALSQTVVLLQTFSVVAMFGMIAGAWKKISIMQGSAWRDPTAFRKLLWVAALVFWIAPHLSPYRISWYRAEALLLPVVLLLAELPRPWQIAMLAVWLPIAWLMALDFFRGILV